MYCRNCGSKLEDDANFCISCGSKTDILPSNINSNYNNYPENTSFIGNNSNSDLVSNPRTPNVVKLELNVDEMKDRASSFINTSADMASRATAKMGSASFHDENSSTLNLIKLIYLFSCGCLFLAPFLPAVTFGPFQLNLVYNHGAVFVGIFFVVGAIVGATALFKHNRDIVLMASLYNGLALFFILAGIVFPVTSMSKNTNPMAKELLKSMPKVEDYVSADIGYYLVVIGVVVSVGSAIAYYRTTKELDKAV